MSSSSDVRETVADRCDLTHLHPSKVAALRAALVGPDDVTDLAETFRALGDPTRVRMLDALSHGELCVCDLAAIVGLSESAVSHQLRLLRNLRLVRPRRDGRMVFYALDDRHIMTLFRQGLRHIQEAGGRAAARATQRSAR
ncbi:MAG TPA: metalloregulator ArsR/SmtB family transcription factor [Vicinamibacterales bacterium]|nr:metalloregulator ArsR/SmtB family transcription factor [Vicinamibacterales bacterium]